MAQQHLPGIQQNDQFGRRLTFSAMLLSSGVQVKLGMGGLAAPTYPAGLSYQSGAILAYDGNNDFINCDPNGIAPQTIAVAILFDDRLKASDETGALLPPDSGTIVGQLTTGMIGEFKIRADALFATALNLSDVAAAMASMNATYDPVSDSYSKF